MGETQIPAGQIKDGTLTDADVATANKDGVAGTASMRTLGTGAQQACAGNDSRLGTDADAVHDNVAAEISAVTEKVAPVGADKILIEDSAASNAKKMVQISNLPTGADAAAIHDDVAAEISALTEKTTPVSGDHLLIEDSAAANAKKRVQIGNLPGATAPTVISKASTESISSSSTLQNDDDLSFAIGASETWTFEVNAVVNEDTGNPNIKIRMGAISGLTGSIEYGWQEMGAAVGGHISDFTTDTGTINLGTSKVTILIRGTVKSTNAGTLCLQWAQATSDVDATNVYALSNLIAHKVA